MGPLFVNHGAEVTRPWASPPSAPLCVFFGCSERCWKISLHVPHLQYTLAVQMDNNMHNVRRQGVKGG